MQLDDSAVKCFLKCSQFLLSHLTGVERGEAGLGGGGGALGPGSCGLGSVRTGHPGPACWESGNISKCCRAVSAAHHCTRRSKWSGRHWTLGLDGIGLAKEPSSLIFGKSPLLFIYTCWSFYKA